MAGWGLAESPMDENVGLAGFAGLIGALVAASVLVRAVLHHLRIPSLLGYLVLGVLLRASEERWGYLGNEQVAIFEFLGELGIIALLFRVGTEAKLSGLVRQFRTAWIIWVSDVVVSGLVGYAVARWALGFDLASSLVVATALTATSVAVSVTVWEDSRLLGSADGQRVLDVAELDDISGVLLMAMLFAVLPALQAPAEGGILSAVGDAAIGMGARILLFGAACFGFARYVEPRVAALCRRLPGSPDRMLTVMAIGIVIAGLAEMLGLSVAIGAFLAGLAFSHDAKSIRIEASFEPIYELFTPFFFLVLGFGMSPQSFADIGPAAGLLLVAAVVGKLVGAGGAARLRLPLSSAAIIGVSMIPRAEIGLLIVKRGHQLGPWAVTDRIYSAMVLVAACTCLIGPLVLARLLRRR
jgi:Kef-type K+ transport system membrane component KefB